MSKSELLQFCRFFKGESQNPFSFTHPLRFYIWMFEQRWVEETLAAQEKQAVSPFLSDALTCYMAAGLSDFENRDGVPVMLKAVLYDLFLKGNELPLNDEFKRFYASWKSKEVA
jgi:hypothetical protein